MTIAVIAVGAALLIFFAVQLRPRARRMAAPAAPAYQDVFVAVSESIEPATIVLLRGLPAKLRIHRTGSAGDEIRIEGMGVTRTLVSGKTTTVDLQPDESGVFEIRMSAGPATGTLIVLDQNE
jgi:plastocyanin domain-containing protein